MWRWFGVLTLPGRGEEREGFTKQLLFSSTCPFELTLGDVQKERRREKGFLQRKEGIFAALSGDFWETISPISTFKNPSSSSSSLCPQL